MYTIKAIKLNTGKTLKTFSFETKKEANKAIKNLIKSGRAERRGYDLFSSKYRNLELRANY